MMDVPALMIASKVGNIKAVELLLYYGAKINLTDINGNNALFYAVYVNYIEIVDVLLKYNININQKNNQEYTPLILSITNNNFEMFKFLIEIGGVDLENDNILSFSCNRKNINFIKYLYQNNYIDNINYQNNNGQTCLILASLFNRLQIIDYLLSLNCNPYILDKWNKSAYEYMNNKSKQILANYNYKNYNSKMIKSLNSDNIKINNELKLKIKKINLPTIKLI